MKKLSILVGFLFFSIHLIGQYQIGLVPRVSPDRSVYEKIAFTEIELKYGSPRVKAREIWGDLVPYGEVWRAGANEATTIEFSEDVIIQGLPLKQGKYAFFVIPGENNIWTIIFNSEHRQWGAYNYDDSKDVLRAEVEAYNSEYAEELNYNILGLDYEYGLITLAWETKKVEIELKTNYLQVLRNKLQDKLSKSAENIHWVAYLQAAEFLLLENRELEQALEWIEASEKGSKNKGEWHHQYYPKEYVLGHMYWTKASILAQMGDFKVALRYVNKMKRLKNQDSFYSQENQYGDLDFFIQEWEAQLGN